MVDDRTYQRLFGELCVQLGFCSLGVDGEDKVKALGPAGADTLARAVFEAEGLDYDTYTPKKVKASVRACIARHLNQETRP
ncbi:hypothetical protein [Brevundimonas sp. LjRoot202]|uniref:hypothetical protein n=1 Tax=Brevundimonas sp. LjRoot202 TaxID=3342281 RepID=UPI003ECDF198